MDYKKLLTWIILIVWIINILGLLYSWIIQNTNGIILFGFLMIGYIIIILDYKNEGKIC